MKQVDRVLENVKKAADECGVQMHIIPNIRKNYKKNNKKINKKIKFWLFNGWIAFAKYGTMM